MAGIPAVCFAAYSGTGKTTFLEQVIRDLHAAGLRVSVIKHAGRIDLAPGKDSSRYIEAGAETSMVLSRGITMMIMNQAPPFAEAAARIPDCDLILVEGYREEPVTQIGMCRRATGKGFTDSLDRYAAVVADFPVDADIPRFSFEEHAAVARFLIENRDSFTRV